MVARVALVKLAAIGDVAIAARALREFVERHEARLELHWIIDRTLEGLARSLVADALEVRFHPIDAEALFQGGAAERARQSIAIMRAVGAARAEQTVLLHRDWRYQVLLRPLVGRKLVVIPRSRERELEVYRKAFAKLGARLHVAEALDEAPLAKPKPAARTGRIGLLIGGARNQKVDYAEKRWPRFSELATLLLRRTSVKLVLFGGPGDTSDAERLITDLVAQSEQSFPGGLSERLENLVGRIPLDRIPAALAGLDSFVSIDTGLAHVAAAVMTAPHQRVVTLFGPTDPGIWAPVASGKATARIVCKAPSCSPCYADDGAFRPCRFEGEYFQHCMTAIQADEILSELT